MIPFRCPSYIYYWSLDWCLMAILTYNLSMLQLHDQAPPKKSAKSEKMAHRVGKKTKKRQKRLDRALNAIKVLSAYLTDISRHGYMHSARLNIAHACIIGTMSGIYIDILWESICSLCSLYGAHLFFIQTRTNTELLNVCIWVFENWKSFEF